MEKRKDKYLELLESQLAEWKDKLEELRRWVDEADTEEIRARLREKFEVLKGKQETARVKLKELSEASDEAWEGLKAGMERSWDDLKGAFEDALSKFKKEDKDDGET